MFSNASASLHSALSAANALEVSRDKDLDALDHRTKKSFVSIVQPFADAVEQHSKASLFEQATIERLSADAGSRVDRLFVPLSESYVESKEKILNDYRRLVDGHEKSLLELRDKLVLDAVEIIKSLEPAGFVNDQNKLGRLVTEVANAPGQFATKYPNVVALGTLTEIVNHLNIRLQTLGRFRADVHVAAVIGKFDGDGSVVKFKKLSMLLTPGIEEIPLDTGKKAGATREVTH